MKACILYIKLVYPDVPDKTVLDPSKSWLLSSISSHKDYEFYGFGAPNMKKAPDLGEVFPDIEPRDDSGYIVELGTILPNLLPNLNDKMDYHVEVIDEEENIHTLCVSNQMVRMHSRKKDEQYHIILPRCHVENLDTEYTAFDVSSDSPQELLRTMVTCRFLIHGSTAEEALESEIETIIDSYISIINRYLAANQMLAKDDAPDSIPSAYDRASFGAMYLIMAGKGDKLRRGRFALNPQKVMLNPKSISGKDADRLLGYLNGSIEIDDIRSMTVSAHNALQSGMLRYALLQNVIVAEMATARFVRKHLLMRGVSKTKLEEAERNITYSVMLNTQIQALAPAHIKPDREIIGIMNRAKRSRNQLMHEGKFDLTRKDLHRIHRGTIRFLHYLDELDKDILGQQMATPE